jgi:hypothetical protein
MTARSVLNAARALFDQWQGADAAERARPPLADGLIEQFEAQQAAAATQPPDESMLADGLLKLLDLERPHRVRRSKIRGVDLEIDEKSGAAGIAVCQTQNMSRFAARLKQIGDALERGIIRRIVIVRDERLPISATATVTQARLRALQERGETLLRPGAAVYAAVTAARQLLADAASGDLSIDGFTVTSDEVRQWLAGARPAAAFGLIDQIDEARSDATDEFVEKLRMVLEGAWVLPLEDASNQAGVDPAVIARRLAGGRRMVGLIAGPPAVVYLRPDGLQRG